MPRNSQDHLNFGPCKYASLHLMLARWLYHTRRNEGWRYITLGGTELRDIVSLSFVSSNAFHEAVSYELHKTSFELASRKAESLRGDGLNVRIVKGDIFSFVRSDERANVFFFDFCGICSLADYATKFSDLFSTGSLRVGDAVIITSYLGYRSGWQKIFNAYGPLYKMLKATDAALKKTLYDSAHPTFTLYNALASAGMINRIKLDCIGSVAYFDTSKMGIYGYTVGEGNTRLPTLVSNSPRFSLTRNEFTNLGLISL